MKLFFYQRARQSHIHETDWPIAQTDLIPGFLSKLARKISQNLITCKIAYRDESVRTYIHKFSACSNACKAGFLVLKLDMLFKIRWKCTNIYTQEMDRVAWSN